MSFQSLTLRLEEFPWKWPLSMGGGVQMLRARTIVEAIDSEGLVHEAELGPCPGVHPESHDEALAVWNEEMEPLLLQKSFQLHLWNWKKPFFGLIDHAGSLSSVQTAVEQLLLSWASKSHPEEFSLPKPLLLPGSALLPIRKAADEEQNWLEFLGLWQEGFRVFKCKIGRYEADHELRFLKRMHEFAGDQLELRLDANQTLAGETLARWRDSCAELPISYWEEPGIHCEQSLHPLALDESLWDHDPAQRSDQADVWILKPTRLTLSETVTLLKRAAEVHRPCILSNAFDSGLSLRCSAWIYAAFCSQPQALGFGTSRFLPDDAWYSRAWSAPLVTVPTQPFAFQERKR